MTALVVLQSKPKGTRLYVIELRLQSENGTSGAQSSLYLIGGALFLRVEAIIALSFETLSILRQIH
jgi:hypothetical protein